MNSKIAYLIQMAGYVILMISAIYLISFELSGVALFIVGIGFVYFGYKGKEEHSKK